MTAAMAEPPRVPPDPPDDDVTVVRDEWGPDETYVERREEVVEPPRRRMPTIWPWLLALLVLVLAGLGALWYFSQDDDDNEARSPTTTAATTTVELQRAVPDVVGTTSSEATETLEDAGFDVNLVAVPSDRPAGTVVAQAPAAGSEEPEGTTIRLNVAQEATDTTGTTTGETTTGETTTGETTTGETTTEATTTAPRPPPPPATVPDVVGQELADAARAFADEGLRVAVRYVPSREAQGRVVAQAQPAGTERQRGDTVQLNVSTGAEPAAAASVPGVVGQRLDQARQTLGDAGFEVLAVDLQGQVRNEDRVASQSPGRGASVPRGSLVLLYVTR
jgi:beta-lactam-binding protein with PASTA domain